MDPGEESPSTRPEEMAAANSTMEATNEVDENERINNSNTNMNNIPRKTSQGDRSFSSQTQRKARTTKICGDSMVNNINSWKLKRSCGKGQQIFVNSFPGANFHDMRTYCKRSIEKKPDCPIIHCGTNELKTNKSDVEISTEIISLANRPEHKVYRLLFLD